MIDRYTLPEMGELWSEKTIKSHWVLVEIAALWAKAKIKMIPLEVYTSAYEALGIDLKDKFAFRVTDEVLAQADKLEAVGDHDLMALIHAASELLPDIVQPHWHDGLTSFDDEDTAMGVIMGKSLEILIVKARRFKKILVAKAKEHKQSLMQGRSHGIHGETITFAHKLLRWVDDMEDHIKELEDCIEKVRVGKLSGAMGVYTTLDPRVEQHACEFLGLRPAKISSQIIDRRIHYNYVATLVGVANTVDKIATDIRNLSRTEIREVREFKRPGAHGSSAMPAKTHLKNPIKFENVCGLSKVMRGYLIPAAECVVLWDERSLDNSAAERIFLPDVTILLDFMLNRVADSMEKLEVYPERMMVNIQLTGGMTYASKVLSALTGKGMDRREAYELLEGLALQTQIVDLRTPEGLSFEHLVRNHPEITQRLGSEEIDACFDHEACLENIEEIYKRFGL